MHRTFPLLALAVLCLPMAGVHAEDEAVKPEAAFEAAVATLPAPSAEHAFTFEGEVRVADELVGTITFAAEPTGDGEAWLVTDALSFAGGAYVRTYTAQLDRRLQPVRGKVTGKEPGTEAFEVTWTRTETGLAVRHSATKAGETVVSEKMIPHTGTTTTTMCSLWLFGRLSGLARGSYAVTVFDADPGPGDATFETATWTQGDKGAWGDRKAVLLEGTKGAKGIAAGFDPQTRALLGIRTASGGQGPDLEIRPVPAAAPEQTDDTPQFSGPPRSAREAALQAGLAFATGDLELVERLLHWPTWYAEQKAAHTGEEPFAELPAYKAAVLEQLGKSLPKMPRPMMEGMLKSMGDQLGLKTLEGGLTQATFPPMLRSMVVTLGEFDGQWYLARLPGAPK